MSKTADNTMVFSVPDGMKAVYSEVIDDGKTIRVILGKDFDIRFPIVRVSSLSLQDSFMGYTPQTDEQKKFMNRLTKAIKRGLKDFRVSAIEPRLNLKGKIVYEAGGRRIFRASAGWWKEELKGVMPERGSKMASKTEYVALLGYIIKCLVSNGWKPDDAWKYICCYSSERLNEIKVKDFAPTDVRLVEVLHNMACTPMILENDDLDKNGASGFVLASNCYYYYDDDENEDHYSYEPVARLTDFDHQRSHDGCFGLLVLEEV